VSARLINIKYITIRAEKVASPVTALQDVKPYSVNQYTARNVLWSRASQRLFVCVCLSIVEDATI